MNIRKVFDFYSTITLLMALAVVAAFTHGKVVLRCLRRILARPAAPKTENEIRTALCLLHRELCNIKGLKISSDFTTISGCPQFDLILESAPIDELGHLHFEYAPWASVADDF